MQGTLEEAFQKITGKRVRVVGAGRTDSGVHAQGQVAHTILHSGRMQPKELLRALNAVLPEDVAVRSLSRTPASFHAIASAKKKRYRYLIWNKPVRPVRDRQYMLHVPHPLDIRAMQTTAKALRGRHNFKAFHSAGRPVRSTIRRLYRLDVRARGGMVVINAEADGFLYHMVRRIVGFLLETGRGRRKPADTGKLLDRDGKLIAPTAPAKGLCLVKVSY